MGPTLVLVSRPRSLNSLPSLIDGFLVTFNIINQREADCTMHPISWFTGRRIPVVNGRIGGSMALLGILDE